MRSNVTADTWLAEAGTGAADAIARLHGQFFSPPWDAPTVADLLSHPGSIALSIRGSNDAELLGYILGRVVLDEAEILSLAVAQTARRHGHARRLVSRLGERARERGAKRLYLEVAAGNAPAIALYESLSFRRIGLRRGYYQHAGRPSEDAVLLGLDLDAGVP